MLIFAGDPDVTQYFSVDRAIVDYFNGLGAWGNFALVAISLIIATFLGGLLGYQREINGHSAGLRTNILISLSSCLIMILSQYGQNSYAGTHDPMRLAAAAITGIGFLGAGSIVQNGVTIKGLTTAATIWVAMAIGMACGAGWWCIAIVSTFIALLVLTSLVKFERLATRTNTNVMVIVDRDNNAIPTLLELAEQKDIAIKDIGTTLVHYGDAVVLRITFKIACRDVKKIQDFLDFARVNIEPIQMQIIQ